MSWDVSLYDDRGHCEGDWNYTHNCNPMIDAVLQAEPDESTFAPHVFGSCWWKNLDGMEGKQGSEFLSRIITGLSGDPERFRAMNPSNGWGNYDQMLSIFQEMRDRVPEWPCVWKASG